jgi:glycosyltransferase XagB
MAKVFSTQAIDRLETNIGAKKLGQLFLDMGYLTPARLESALEYQQKNGGRLGWILASLGYITRLEMYHGLAKHLSLPFETDTNYLLHKIDRRLAARLTHEEMVRCQVVPFYISGKTLSILTSEPDNPETLLLIRQKFPAKQITQVLVTDLDIMRLSSDLYRRTILNSSINGLANRKPEETAFTVFSRPQIAFTAGFLGMLALLLFRETEAAVLTLMFAVQFFFAVPLLYKLGLAVWGRIMRPAFNREKAERPFNSNELPVYSILVPVYQEKEVIRDLMKCIKKLDYPEDKLDIILLLEEDDKETFQAAKAEKPSANWRFLTVPDSLPRTKPKALNYGLAYTRGEFLTVYDAEGLPEPDQLKKAVAAFRTRPDDYICFEAGVSYFNKNENLLTRLTTLEHAVWSDCLQPALFRMGLPVPQGGTNGHYDVKKLRSIGAWDPFNTASGADLGVRAAMEGYRTGVIDSTTYEETTSRLKNWLGQSSRQFKGCLQTFFVYSRNPGKMIKSLGFFRWAGQTLLSGGIPAAAILNPVMWILLAASIYLDYSGTFYVPNEVIYLTAFNIIAGNVITVFVAVLGATTQKNRKLILPALLSPLWWMLESIAAYKGLWQLFFKPFYWEKTAHGVTEDIPISRTQEIPDNVTEMVVVRERE